MRIPIDPAAPSPLYEQIAAFFRERCRSGSFVPGTKLPSARELAEELGISRVTAESAYSQLESEALVVRRMGSGTYVAERASLQSAWGGEIEAPLWQALAARGSDEPGIAPGVGLRAEGPPGAIDLASGLADPALLPAATLRRALREALAEAGEGAFDYGDPSGFAPFRESVARVLSSRGIDAGPEDILVTSGSQEAILLCALLALRRGGPVLVESPTYAVAMGLFRALGLEVVGVPADGGGIRIDALERAIGELRPSLIYTMPNFQNPTGASLEAGRRSALVALAERHALPILEDDYVGDLRLEGRDLPALASIAAPGAVLYTGTFSKMLAPGFRVGYLLARGPVRALLLDLKYRISLASPNVEQRALRSVVSVGGYENHIRRSRRRYRERRDALMLAVAESLPGFRADRPAGGLFAWLRLPEGLGSRRLAEACRARGVLVYPGWPCFPDSADPEADRYLRLNFAAEREERIEEGVRRIAAAAAGIASPRLPTGSA